MLKKKVLPAILLTFFLLSPVFAVSYVDLERTTTGEFEGADYGFALDFDASDYVQVPHDDTITFTTEEFTVEYWLKLSSHTNKHHVSKGAYNNDGWYIQEDSNGRLVLKSLQVGAWQGVWTVNDALPLDQWHHVVFIRKDYSVSSKVYINATDRTDTGRKLKDPPINTRNLELGRSCTGSYYLDGCIDEVRIYNRAINLTEIEYSYNSGDGRHTSLNETGLVAWYHINEGTGTDVFDETANDNDGVLTLGEGDEWITGKVPTGTSQYPANIVVTDLESSYEVKLVNSTGGLVTNATANSEGTVNMTVPSGYRSSAFEGTFRVYDDNSTFLYSKWFEDVAGGDEYRIRTKIGGLAFGVIALVLALCAFVIAIASKGRR